MKKIIVGNWKMYLKKGEAMELLQAIKNNFKKRADLQVVFCPSFVDLPVVADFLKENSSFFLGAQDSCWENQGAFTGEVSPKYLKEIGCSHVILGHSERRKYLGETDDLINKKVIKALANGLIPILCVGGTKEERNNGETLKRIEDQLKNCLKDVKSEEIIIAYEPVWAISTEAGEPCSPAEAEKIHGFIKEKVAQLLGIKDIFVLYGGSVDDTNVDSFLKQKNVGGVLVGGASVKKDIFVRLLSNA